MRRRMHQPIPDQGKWLGRVVRGYLGPRCPPMVGHSRCSGIMSLTYLCGGRAMKSASLPLFRRREFIALLGGAGVWPLAAWAQQSVRQRHVGVLMTGSPDTGLVMLQALKTRLSELGWVDGKTPTAD